MCSVRPWLALSLAFSFSWTAWGQPPDDERRRERSAPAVYDFSDDALSGEMLSATPGGAQDIAFFRDRVAAGEIPHANVFTPEGLFSEHDLPLGKKARCRQLLCATGEATAVRLLAQPNVRALGQLGFSSNIDAKKFRRAPLNLVAVVDKSGSMQHVLPLVQASLREVLAQLGPRDQLAIVLYGDTVDTLVLPTRADPAGRRVLAAAIDRIESNGSTAMEEGLRVGFRLARRSARAFEGTTRVMLFTDERPNVGATDRHSFMSMARSASNDGIGMTTIGVGLQFGAELATAISSVRGGNLLFFPDAATMKRKFEDDFDTMVSELAHDLHLRVRPGKGLKLAGIYGIPGDKLQWGPDGSLELHIATVFLSRRSGAIYVAVEPAGSDALPRVMPAVGDAIAFIELAFTPLGGKRRTTTASLATVALEDASVGLVRGALLVDEATVLKEAARLHNEANDQEGAYQLVHALAGRFRALRDPTLEAERTLVLALEQSLALRSGHAGEPSARAGVRDPVSGLPR